MIQFRPGSQVWQLITMLSIVGELPFRNVSVLGSERVFKSLITKLTSPQTFRNSQTGETHTCRMLTINGKSVSKSVRLYKGALPLLEWIHPNAYACYMDTFWQHAFPGDAAHRERNHRISEAAILCMRAGIEARPYLLPVLQNEALLKIVPDQPSLYLAKSLKKVQADELNKTMFSRMVGAVFAGRCVYAVYNTRSEAMKWNGTGEFKTLQYLSDISRMNTDAYPINGAILFGQNEEIALQTMLVSEKSRRMEFRFDAVYRHIHFIPMNDLGIRQLRLLCIPNFREELLDLLFIPECRSFDRGVFEYDALVNGTYILSHLDGDIARLMRFREAIMGRPGCYEVLCFHHQVRFLQRYLDQRVSLKTIALDIVEAELNITRRNLLEQQ